MRYHVVKQFVVIDTLRHRKPVVATAASEGEAYKIAYRKEAAAELRRIRSLSSASPDTRPKPRGATG